MADIKVYRSKVKAYATAGFAPAHVERVYNVVAENIQAAQELATHKARVAATEAAEYEWQRHTGRLIANFTGTKIEEVTVG